MYRSEDRGSANHGWLQAKHSFSFGNFYNPNLMHFGVLRVLNDDIIEASMGFGTHPHDNMEIITIPLEGALAHKDSMGHSSIIKAGEIQVMSAGTGIQHSEYNALDDQSINLLQIWLFPNKRNVTPRYQQQELDTAEMHNKWSQVLSPSADDQGVWIHQDAWFHMGEFDAGKEMSYEMKDPLNGLYVFVIEGEADIEGLKLGKRDAAGITQATAVPFRFTEKSKVLLLEVPMS